MSAPKMTSKGVDNMLGIFVVENDDQSKGWLLTRTARSVSSGRVKRLASMLDCRLSSTAG